MRILLSLNSKQVGPLYHKTTKQALLKILRSGKLELSTGRGTSIEHQLQAGKNFFASLTRSRFGAYHFRDGGKTSNYGADVLVTLDGTALSSREKIVPVDYWGNRGSIDPNLERSKEVEERLVSNKSEIPILKYIKRVDFITNAVHGKVEDYGFDKGKFKIHENEQQPLALGSIVLQLKKHKIKYGFFDNMKDWAMRQGEYSYTGPKEVSVVGPVEYNSGSVRSYQDLQALLEALSDLPYEKLSKRARERCEQMSRYPNDVDSVFNDYEYARKPDAPAPHRAMAMKITRVLQRLGFSEKTAAGKFMAAKANAHYAAEQKREDDKRASTFAPFVIEALTKPISEWSDSPNPYLAPKAVFLEITDRFGYMYGEAVRLVTRALQSDVPEVAELKQLMKSMQLDSADDVVSKIYYGTVKPYQQSK